jgi:LPXTG-site transpeptidase (sortase) family protein
MDRNFRQRPGPRILDPITAIGALIAVIATTALITYAALTLPGKLAAAGGPPEEFLAAATRQAALVAVTATPDDPLAEEPAQAQFPTSTATEVVDAQTGVSAGPAATANPYGDWPFTGDSDYWLTIQSINLEAPIIAFLPWDREVDGVSVLRLPVPNSFAVSWDERSAEPGFAGNTIISGHSNAYGGVFGDLDKVPYGGEVALWSRYGVFSYYVSSITYIEEKDQPLDVRLQNARIWLGQSSDTRVTLITCWPASDSSQRLIVVATR